MPFNAFVCLLRGKLHNKPRHRLEYYCLSSVRIGRPDNLVTFSFIVILVVKVNRNSVGVVRFLNRAFKPGLFLLKPNFDPIPYQNRVA
jgi:hypothetical protein